MKKRILIPLYNRSATGILQPVINELKKSETLEPIEWNIFHGKGDFAYITSEFNYQLQTVKPQAVFLPFDRREIVPVATQTFYRGLVGIHLQAGDLSRLGSLDDTGRWIISLCSQIHFCQGSQAEKRTKEILTMIGRELHYVYNCGSYALDDISLDNSICPPSNYFLVLYNPISPFDEITTLTELDHIKTIITDCRTVWIRGNGELGTDFIEKFAQQIPTVKYYPNLPRPQFLGLLKYCFVFIGNSSSQFFEAPALGLTQNDIIHIGKRNVGREFPEDAPMGGSIRIRETLEKLADAGVF